MEKPKVFKYQYSAAQNKEVERIRKKYLPPEDNKLDTLRKLDRQARNAGTAEGLVIGTVGCLIFGVGMCFGLDILAGADWLTALFCIIGAATMIPAYPVSRHISRKTKKKLTPEILRLSEELMKS